MKANEQANETNKDNKSDGNEMKTHEKGDKKTTLQIQKMKINQKSLAKAESLR